MYISKHCKLVRKNNFYALLFTESVCSSMNVRNPKPWDTKHGVTLYFRFYVLEFFMSLMCVWLEKLLYWLLYTQTNQLDYFRRFHKILRWIGSSDFNIHVYVITMQIAAI